jgi:hypothetical protein
MKCFREHCGSDVDRFKERWGDNFLHFRFAQLRCPGPMWLRAGQDPLQQQRDDHFAAWQIYVLRHYGYLLSDGERFDLQPLSPGDADLMLKCGADFGMVDWESRYDFVPSFAGLGELPVDAYLAEVRARHRRYNDIPCSMMANASFARLKRLRNIVTCLDEHCGGSGSELAKRWPNFRSTDRRCPCLARFGGNATNMPDSPEPDLETVQ